MNEDKSNVVTLRPAGPAVQSQREYEARLLAILASLPALEYERLRGDAAKQLKCRVAWLDKIIRGIRSSAAYLTAAPAQGRGTGDRVNFVRDDGTEITGFIVATDRRSDPVRHLLVLADGNATTVRSIPITPAHSAAHPVAFPRFDPYALAAPPKSPP